MRLLANTVKRLLGTRVLLRTLCRARQAPVVVLAYHDLCDEDASSSWLRVTTRAFARQLDFIRRCGNFLRPEELFRPECHRPGRLNVLLTFDDGFVNQHRLGVPLLQKFEAPALFFLSTRHLLTGEPFWFDRIAAAVGGAGGERVELQAVGLGTYDFTKAAAPARWLEVARLLEDLKKSGRTQINRTIAYLEDLFPCQPPQRSCRPLNVGELAAMQGSGICHFGSHSHAHELLPTLNDGELRENLLLSRQILAEAVGGEVRHLAYPNGDADRRVIDFARVAGYRCGYQLRPALLRAQDDPMALPRVAVGGFDDVATLGYKLNRALLRG